MLATPARSMLEHASEWYAFRRRGASQGGRVKTLGFIHFRPDVGDRSPVMRAGNPFTTDCGGVMLPMRVPGGASADTILEVEVPAISPPPSRHSVVASR